jgi:hypothetical protein
MPHLEYSLGDVGELLIEIDPPCSTAAPVEHDQFALRMADPDWWDTATGRPRPNTKMGLRRRAKQYRLELFLDEGQVSLPLVLHRPLARGHIIWIRIVHEPAMKTQGRIEFAIHAKVKSG